MCGTIDLESLHAAEYFQARSPSNFGCIGFELGLVTVRVPIGGSALGLKHLNPCNPLRTGPPCLRTNCLELVWDVFSVLNGLTAVKT